jgi:hypothetical protein
MAAQKVFRGLVEEELQIQGARVRQRYQKAGQSAAGATDHEMAEVSPVHLRLFVMVRAP